MSFNNYPSIPQAGYTQVASISHVVCILWNFNMAKVNTCIEKSANINRVHKRDIITQWLKFAARQWMFITITVKSVRKLLNNYSDQTNLVHYRYLWPSHNFKLRWLGNEVLSRVSFNSRWQAFIFRKQYSLHMIMLLVINYARYLACLWPEAITYAQKQLALREDQ